jgi:hypothetical protein
MKEICQILEDNLLSVIDELETQSHLGNKIPSNILSLEEQIAQWREFIELAGEYEIAYESIIALLEILPFKLTSITAIKLIEIALLLRYKTDRDEDKIFDSRPMNLDIAHKQ